MKQRGKERLPAIPVSLLPVLIGESLSQTTTSHFETCFNPGLPENRPHPNRTRHCCQGHPSHRMGEEQSLLISANAFFQPCRLERALGSLASPGSLAFGCSDPPALRAAACFLCRTPSPPCTHPAQGAPGVCPLPGLPLELKHRGRCPPRSGQGQEVLWLAQQPAPWRPASVQFPRLSGQVQGS